jgi:hypothetical protein
MDDRTYFTKMLLADWVSCRANSIGHHSVAIVEDYRALVAAAKVTAILVEVPWDDALVPDHVSDAIAWADADA